MPVSFILTVETYIPSGGHYSDGPSGAYAPPATAPVQHFAPPVSMPDGPVSFPAPTHSTPDQGQGQAYGLFPAPNYPPPEKEYGSSSGLGYPPNEQFVPYGQGQLEETPS